MPQSLVLGQGGVEPILGLTCIQLNHQRLLHDIVLILCNSCLLVSACQLLDGKCVHGDVILVKLPNLSDVQTGYVLPLINRALTRLIVGVDLQGLGGGLVDDGQEGVTSEV